MIFNAGTTNVKEILKSKSPISSLKILFFKNHIKQITLEQKPLFPKNL